MKPMVVVVRYLDCWWFRAYSFMSDCSTVELTDQLSFALSVSYVKSSSIAVEVVGDVEINWLFSKSSM